MILQNMKNLLLHLPGLERLELVDLQLDGHDGEYTRLTLKRLSLVLSLLFMIFDIYSWGQGTRNITLLLNSSIFNTISKHHI